MTKSHGSQASIRTLVLLSTLALSSLLLSSCESMTRYQGTDAVADHDRGESGLVALGDSGDIDNDVASRQRLRKAEDALEGKREREQYFRNKPYMRNDRERLNFLSLDSYEDRQRWLAKHGISATSVVHSPQVQALIEENDIALGMTKMAVKESWGEPELVEVAGNPMYGNERWHYTEQKSSTEGYRGEKRVIYFESGRVVGWETH